MTDVREPDRPEPPDEEPPDEEPTGLDRFLRIGSYTGLALLVFVAGSLLTVKQIFPGPQISRAYEGGVAFYRKMVQTRDVYGSDLWYPERRKDRGVTVHDRERAQEGVTLYLSGSEAAAHLIDMDGTVLHSWKRPYSSLQEAGVPSVQNPQPDSHVYFRHAYVLPDGGLIALYEGAGDTPYGYGVVKLDRDSGIVWSYAGRAHHQFDVGPDGRIYVLTHEFVDDEIENFGNLARPRLDDFLVVLSPDGEELKKIRLVTAVSRSPYRQMLHTVAGYSLADPLHANTVEFIDREKAANFAFGSEGQILLSFRETHSLAVLDVDSGEIVWATRGPWLGQHDPDIMPNGNILLFDNYGAYDGPEGVSRVIEFDPVTMEIVWEYRGTPDAPLDSLIRSDQQRLPNGNTLINESNGGRLVEVTRDGEIVWEFVNPVRGGEGDALIPIIAWAKRLDPATLDPALLESRERPVPEEQGEKP